MDWTWAKLLLGLTALASYTTTNAALASGRWFEIEVGTPPGHIRNLALEVRQTYKKYGFRLTKEMIEAGGNNVTANPEYNSRDQVYLTRASVGTPPQYLDVEFDTGSSDLWLFSDKLPEKQSEGHAIFKTASSTSWNLSPDETYSITYGDGSITSGIVGTDTFSVGRLTAPQQGVEAATDVSKMFSKDKKYSGIVGFGFSSANQASPNKVLTFFDNIAGSLDQKVFCVDFHNHTQKSSYSFGKLDKTKYSGYYEYMDVDASQGEWKIQIVGAAVTPPDFGQVPAFNQPAVVDTGTAAIYTDESLVTKYWGQVNGATFDAKSGLWKFPCDQTNNMPLIQFDFPQNPDTMQGPWNGFAFAAIQGSYLINRSVKGTCYGALLSNQGSGLTIFGVPWFKWMYTCFDQSSGSPKIVAIPRSVVI